MENFFSTDDMYCEPTFVRRVRRRLVVRCHSVLLDKMNSSIDG